MFEITIIVAGAVMLVSSAYKLYLKNKNNDEKKFDVIYQKYSHLPRDDALIQTESYIRSTSKKKINENTLSYYLLEKKIKQN